MNEAVIALGGNLGDRVANLIRAREQIAHLGELSASSYLYETPPVGPPQDHYLNAAVLLKTELDPHTLLHRLLSIENAMGRKRSMKWGPRSIDLDLISFGDEVLHSPSLTLPHPEAHHRAFVLVPLLDLCPDKLLRSRKSVREWVDSLNPEALKGIHRVPASGWDEK